MALVLFPGSKQVLLQIRLSALREIKSWVSASVVADTRSSQTIQTSNLVRLESKGHHEHHNCPACLGKQKEQTTDLYVRLCRGKMCWKIVVSVVYVKISIKMAGDKAFIESDSH